ncbi:hypothetical protein QBC43DRAFT_324761 [Cladorrhinum sp. PSN259]|nr:hypothetical protein QBC43DRAFT_324761 [Cladorrhinum sp. PSN259]
MPPTTTLPNPLSRLLTARQATTTVVVDNNSNGGGGGGGGNNGLDSGAIVGIVLGVIAAILLLWWIFRSCSQPRKGDGPRPREGYYEEPMPRRSRSRSASRHSAHRHHHHRHSSGHRHSSSRRRSSSRSGVVLEEKHVYGSVPVAVAQPAAVYYEGGSGARRSRSGGRYYEGY